MPCFTELHSMFYYDSKTKKLPPNIYDILTPLALAYWIMVSGVRLGGRGLLIYANTFSISDALTLINILIIKYRLVCNLQLDKGRSRIYIFRSSIDTLITHIKPNLDLPRLRDLFEFK